jgi:hypothetical protein
VVTLKNRRRRSNKDSSSSVISSAKTGARVSELGAEGGTQSNTLFLAVLQGFFNFLRKTAPFKLRTNRTSRTWLYLSCSQLVPDGYEQHRWSNFSTDGKSGTSQNVDGGFSISTPKSQLGTVNKRSEYTSIGQAQIIRHDRCSNPRGLAYGWQLLATPPHVTLIRLRGINMAAKEFTRIPTDPNEREEFDRQYMTPRELAQRWRVSESAIHHRKAGSNNLPRYYFGRAVRFIRQDVYDFENQKLPLPLR